MPEGRAGAVGVAEPEALGTVNVVDAWSGLVNVAEAVVVGTLPTMRLLCVNHVYWELMDWEETVADPLNEEDLLVADGVAELLLPDGNEMIDPDDVLWPLLLGTEVIPDLKSKISFYFKTVIF